MRARTGDGRSKVFAPMPRFLPLSGLVVEITRRQRECLASSSALSRQGFASRLDAPGHGGKHKAE